MAEVKGITVAVGANTSEFKKAMAGLRSELMLVQNDLKLVEAGLKMNPNSAELLTQKLKLLHEQSDIASKKIAKINETIEKLNKIYADGQITEEQYSRELELLTRRLESAQTEQRKYNQDIANFTKETGLSQTAIEKVTAILSEYNAKMKDLDTEAQAIAKNLATVNNALKLDPGDTGAAAEKMKLLQDAVANTASRIDVVKEAMRKLNEQYSDKASQEYINQMKELDRQMETAVNDHNLAVSALNDYQLAVENAGKATETLTNELTETKREEDAIAQSTEVFTQKMNAINERSKELSTALKTVSDHLKITPDSIEKVSEKLTLLEQTSQNAKNKVELIKDQIQKLNEQYSDKSSEDYKTRLAALESQLKQATREQELAEAAVKKYKNEINETAPGVGKLAEEEDKAAKSAKEFADKMTSIQKEAQFVAQQLKLVEERLKLDPKNVELVNEKVNLLVQACSNAISKVDAIRNEIRNLNNQYADRSSEEYNARLKELNNQLQIAEKEYKLAKEKLNSYANEVQNASGKVDNLEKETKETNKELENTGDSAKKAESGISQVAAVIEGRLTSSAIMAGLRSLWDMFVGIAEAAWDAVEGLAKGIGQFVSDGMKLAETAQQTQMKVKQVFGDSAESVTKWSLNSVQAFGLTIQNAQAAAVEMGNMLTALGMTDEKAAEMSMTMVQLAADMGAFNNVETTEVLQAMSSMIAGQTRPMRQYGVVLNANMVAERALLQTGKEKKEELTEEEKAYARLTLAIEQASKQSGQFGRESDSITVQTQKLRAQIDQMKEDIGAKLLPVQTKLYKQANDFLSSPVVQSVIERLVQKADELGKKLLAIVENIDWNQFNESVNAVADQFVKWVNSTIEFVQDGRLEELITNLIENLPTIVETVGDIIDKIIEALPYIARITDEVLQLFGIKTENQKIKEAFIEVEDEIAKAAKDTGIDTDLMIKAIHAYAEQTGTDVLTIYQNWQEYQPKVSEFIKQITTDANGGKQDLSTALSDMTNSTRTNVESQVTWWDRLKQTIHNVREALDIDIGEIIRLLAGGPFGSWAIADIIGGGVGNLLHRAGGGRAYANMPILVGDDAQRRPEIFVPDTNGTILNGDQTERVLNNINNSRTVGDVNIYLNSYGADATSIANEIGIAVQQKLRMSGAMLY